MELSIKVDLFYKQIQKIQGIVSSKSIDHLLSYFLLEASDGKIKIFATDNNIGFSVSIPAQVSTGGVTCLPGKIVFDILRELPKNQDVHLLSESNGRMQFVCQQAVFHVPVILADDYPEFPVYIEDTGIEISSSLFATCFKKINVTVPWTEQPFFKAPPGALFVIKEGVLEMAGTDGHRMSYLKKENIALTDPISILLPKKILEELPKLIEELDMEDTQESGQAKDTDGIKLKTIFSENYVIFIYKGVKIFSLLLEHKFPNFKSRLKEKMDKRIVLKKEEFKQIVRRVSLISQKEGWLIRLMITNSGKLFLDSQGSSEGDAHDELSIDYNGEPLNIGLNPKFILDFLNIIDTPEIVMELKDPKSPVFLSSCGVADLKYIMMPIELDGF